MIIVPYGMATLKTDFVISHSQPFFQMWLNENLSDLIMRYNDLEQFSVGILRKNQIRIDYTKSEVPRQLVLPGSSASTACSLIQLPFHRCFEYAISRPRNLLIGCFALSIIV